jgi:hypothetical protein
MRRTKSILAVSATMVMMLAATAGPAMAADNDHHDNRVDNRIDNRMDRLDNRIDNHLVRLDNTPLVGDLFNNDVVLDSGLISDFDPGFVGDIDNGFIVDNGHSFVDMHR